MSPLVQFSLTGLGDTGRQPIAVRVGKTLFWFLLYQNGVSRQSTRAASVNIKLVLSSPMRHASRALFVMIFAACAGSIGAGAAWPNGLVPPVDFRCRASSASRPARQYAHRPRQDLRNQVALSARRLPVEITAKFENWRRIRDSDGTEGWVYHSLLSGKRTGMVIAKTRTIWFRFTKIRPPELRGRQARARRGRHREALHRRLVRHQRDRATTATSSRSGSGASIRTRRWTEATGLVSLCRRPPFDPYQDDSLSRYHAGS